MPWVGAENASHQNQARLPCLDGDFYGFSVGGEASTVMRFAKLLGVTTWTGEISTSMT